MSQLAFSSFDSMLLVRDAHGRYRPASVEQILSVARQAIDQNNSAARCLTRRMWSSIA